jgi:regulator of protease activity HflC (stomatin/prohibitin superfamily)
MENINIKKISIISSIALAAFILVMNLFTIVSAGTSKVQTTFGTVNPKHFGEGIHFPVNPLSGFDVFDTRNQRYEVEGLTIPTQDRFNSTGNVTVLYRIEDSRTPFIKQSYGSAEEFIDKTMRQHLRSIIRDEGRKIQDSRGLAQSDNTTAMQENTRIRLQEALEGTGISVQELLLQDIQFDPRIAEQILQTQQRIQREEAESSQLRIIATQAKQVETRAAGEAKAKNETANAEAYQIEAKAKADAAATLARASAERDAMFAIAEGNLKLTQSLTTAILEDKRIANEAILFSKSQGNVPTTVIGTDSGLKAYGVPIATK